MALQTGMVYKFEEGSKIELDSKDFNIIYALLTNTVSSPMMQEMQKLVTLVNQAQAKMNELLESAVDQGVAKLEEPVSSDAP